VTRAGICSIAAISVAQAMMALIRRFSRRPISVSLSAIGRVSYCRVDCSDDLKPA